MGSSVLVNHSRAAPKAIMCQSPPLPEDCTACWSHESVSVYESPRAVWTSHAARGVWTCNVTRHKFSHVASMNVIHFQLQFVTASMSYAKECVTRDDACRTTSGNVAQTNNSESMVVGNNWIRLASLCLQSQCWELVGVQPVRVCAHARVYVCM